MDKDKVINRTDTVSSIDENDRVIVQTDKRSEDFDYTYFCKNTMKKKKGWVDANFLVPLKLLKECEGVQEEEFYVLLERWMGIYKQKKGSIDYFWIYLTYCGGYGILKKQSEDEDIRNSISKNVTDDAKTHMNDVSKLEKVKYIVQQCGRDDMHEYWILKVYEITVKQIYSSADMALVVEQIIEYLRKCDIKIEPPAFIDYDQNGGSIYSFAANLMLLVTRLHLHIDVSLALKLYKKGNAAYFRYRDRMLAEYIRLSDMYFYQSYERLVKMKICAVERKNKYAAKEVGDIYRLGMELQDMHGNRVTIEADEKAACEYYRICLDAEYIPAYVSAVKTGALINMKQQEEILGIAKAENNPEGLAYYAERCIEAADAHEATDSDKALGSVKHAVNAMIFIDDGYAEKYILENLLLQSKAFAVYKSGKLGKDVELNGMLQSLYSKDVIAMDDNMITAEIEKLYKLAGECGFFEAEYRLGKLFQNSNADKSNEYFEQGKEKGCVWCLLECAQRQRKRDPGGWLRTMLRLGQNMSRDDILCVRLAEGWISGDDVLKQVADGQIELKMNELMEIYLQLGRLCKCLCDPEEQDSILLSAELVRRQKNVKELILNYQKPDES